MSAVELGRKIVAEAKEKMRQAEFSRKKVAETENEEEDSEVCQLTEDVVLEVYGGKRKRSDSMDTAGPTPCLTPKKLDTRESPTVVLKRWIEEGYNIGWPKKCTFEDDDTSEEMPYYDNKLSIHGKKSALECHGCGNHARTLRNLMWYDTGDDGTQLCGKCDNIFYDEYIKHRTLNK